MVTLKMLKPYYIKTEKNYVRIILAYQYFSVVIKNRVFQFIPVEANEIRLNRKTEKIENIDAVFAFQNGKDIVNVPMAKLITLPDFLEQIQKIGKPYYFKNTHKETEEEQSDNAEIIAALEKANIVRLIDKALDERDEQTFNELTKLLNKG